MLPTQYRYYTKTRGYLLGIVVLCAFSLLLTKSSALSMMYFLRGALDAVAEDAEVEEDIGNCDE